MIDLTAARRRRVSLRSKLKDAPPEPERRSVFPIDPAIFIPALCLYLTAACLLAFYFKYGQGDALSRTYSALATIYSEYPKLTTLGFVWPPLPALLQLPLVVFKPLAFYGFAGMIVTSLFGAATLVIMDRLYRYHGFGRWHRLGLGLLFALNPFILYYSVNGMSEIVFVFFFAIALYYFVIWNGVNQWRHVAMMAIAVGFSFYARYDAMALAGALFLAIVLSMPRRGERAAITMEGTLLSYTTVIGYSIGLWVFLNWLFMHDPFFFYQSEYSNFYVTRFMSESPDVIALQESVLATILYLVEKMFRLSPIFVVLAPCLGLLGLVRRHATLVLTVLVSLAVPVFQVYMFRQGTTFGFDRFYISAIPAAFVLYALFVNSMNSIAPNLKTMLPPVLLAALLASTGLTMQLMYQEGTSTPEGTLLRAVLSWQPIDNYALDAEVASYTQSHVEGREVLADSAYADRIILFTQDPKLFVQTSDQDFQDVLRDPVGKVTYILTVSPDFSGFNAVADRYPSLWSKGTPFARLEKDFGTYRLYRVIPPAAALQTGMTRQGFVGHD